MMEQITSIVATIAMQPKGEGLTSRYFLLEQTTALFRARGLFLLWGAFSFVSFFLKCIHVFSLFIFF